MAPVKTPTRRDQTRTRIIATADDLFHRLGFSRTTVADIAEELGMSPANIYKFFSSKKTLVQAVGERNLELVKKSILKAVQKEDSGIAKIKVLALTLYRFHQEKLRHEKEIYRLMTAAHDEQWPCAVEFKKFLSAILIDILRESIDAKEFSPTDLARTSGVLMDSLTWITHPVLLYELKNVHVAQKIEAQARFIQKALA